MIDDAHWAGEVSLRWVHYIGRRLEGVRAVVALALRPAEPGLLWSRSMSFDEPPARSPTRPSQRDTS